MNDDNDDNISDNMYVILKYKNNPNHLDCIICFFCILSNVGKRCHGLVG